MSEPVTCVLCKETCKNNLVAYHDAKYVRVKNKPICPECLRECAKKFIDEN